MAWDIPHQRAAGLTVQVLRPVGVYAILANLFEFPHMHPTEICNVLTAADLRDAPLTGRRGFDLPGVSRRLGLLRSVGLIERCDESPDVGRRATYEVSRLGAGMIGSLESVADWGMEHYDLIVRAARIRRGLDPAAVRIPAAQRRRRPATGMSLGMFDMRWTYILLARIRIADGGVEASVAEADANRTLAGIPERVRHRLNRSTTHAVLGHLETVGLVGRHHERTSQRPPRVLFSATAAGAGLMDALWPTAEWGVPRDGLLAQAVGAMSSWFEPSSLVRAG